MVFFVLNKVINGPIIASRNLVFILTQIFISSNFI